MATPISPRRELFRIVRHMPPDKIRGLIRFARAIDVETLTPEEEESIRIGLEQIKNGQRK